MPEECASVIKEMMDSGSLEVIAASIHSFEKQDSQIAMRYTAGGRGHVLTADAVINCMGQGLHMERIKEPLVESLVKQGLICTSDSGVGMNALTDGTIIKKDGSPSAMMYTMGPLLRGVLWEIVAIPEISMQAKELAELILSKVHQPMEKT